MTKIINTVLSAAALLLCVSTASAEKNDHSKPIEVEADSASLDQQKNLMVYEGNVIVTQGSLRLKASQVTVKENEKGQQFAVATGSPATFRQRLDGGKNEWVEAQAKRIEYDSAKEIVTLIDNARAKRSQDMVMGQLIVYQAKTGTFQVSGGKKSANPSSGRVTVILQPKPDAP